MWSCEDHWMWKILTYRESDNKVNYCVIPPEYFFTKETCVRNAYEYIEKYGVIKDFKLFITNDMEQKVTHWYEIENGALPHMVDKWLWKLLRKQRNDGGKIIKENVVMSSKFFPSRKACVDNAIEYIEKEKERSFNLYVTNEINEDIVSWYRVSDSKIRLYQM